MKKLLLILLSLPMFGFGQICGFGGTNSVNSCMYNENTAPTKAKIYFEGMVNRTNGLGYNTNIKLVRCDLFPNAAAYQKNGIKYIGYNQSFMTNLLNNSAEQIAVFYHEIGHHKYNHLSPTFDKLLASNTGNKLKYLEISRSNELEADFFMGYCMAKDGFTLEEAQSVYYKFVNNMDDTYKTHPKLSKRLKAIENGYNSRKSIERNGLKDEIAWLSNPQGPTSKSSELIASTTEKYLLWNTLVLNKDYNKRYSNYIDKNGTGLEEITSAPEACFINEFQYTWKQKRLYNRLKYEPTNGKYAKFTNMSFKSFAKKYFNNTDISGNNCTDFKGEFQAIVVKINHDLSNGFCFKNGNDYKITSKIHQEICNKMSSWKSRNGNIKYFRFALEAKDVNLNHYCSNFKCKQLFRFIEAKCDSWCPYHHQYRTTTPQAIK